MSPHIGNESTNQLSPPFKHSLFVFLSRDAMVSDVFGFDNVDTDLGAVILQEMIEMIQSQSLLLFGGCKLIIAGIGIDDRSCWCRR